MWLFDRSCTMEDRRWLVKFERNKSWAILYDDAK